VEHALGVLQTQWRVLCNLAHLWDKSTMKTMWMAMVIMDNMIVEDQELDVDLDNEYLLELTIIKIDQFRVPRPIWFEQNAP
jgi:hypothetical protein